MKRYGGLEVTEVKVLKQLGEEIAKLKRAVSELSRTQLRHGDTAKISP